MDNGASPPSSLEELRNYNIALVEELFEDFLNNGVEYDNNIFPTTDRGRADVALIANVAQQAINNNTDLPSNFTWKTVDNVDINLNASEVLELAQAMFTYIHDMQVIRINHLNNINAITDIQELLDYYVFSLWPVDISGG